MMYPYSYSYEYYYTGRFTFLVIAILAAVILSIVLYFTFLNKKNEGKYKGFTGKIYNFFNFNKFYAEEILKLVYIISAAVLTVVSIVGIFSTAFLASLLILILGNIALRVTYELIMMFIILCRKTVSVDKKLDKIAASCGGETRTADSSSDGMKTTMCGGKTEQAANCDGKAEPAVKCCNETEPTANCYDETEPTAAYCSKTKSAADNAGEASKTSDAVAGGTEMDSQSQAGDEAVYEQTFSDSEAMPEFNDGENAARDAGINDSDRGDTDDGDRGNTDDNTGGNTDDTDADGTDDIDADDTDDSDADDTDDSDVESKNKINASDR